MGAPASARARFRSGLLAWLRAPHDPSGLSDMLAAVREVAAEASGGARVQWRSAETFLGSLLDGGLPVDDESRQLCRRIERQLAADDVGESDLAAAIFSYVSRRVSPAVGSPTTVPTPLPLSLGGALGATADLLPLIAGAVRSRFSDAQVNCWLEAVRAVDGAWRSLGLAVPGEAGATIADGCRRAATRLLDAALGLNDSGALKLAESIATAAEFVDQREVREHPQLRAALAAALEMAGEPDAPNHPRFATRTAVAVDRLEGAVHLARLSGRAPAERGMARIALSTAAWTVADGRETIHAMRAALAAIPPQAAVLQEGARWFARQEAIAASVALQGLAALLEQIVSRVAPVVLDRRGVHQTLTRAVEAMSIALEAIAAGELPQPDPAAFKGLRGLLHDLPIPRQDG